MARKTSRRLSYSVFYEQVPEGGYVAFVPMLPSCHTQGETLEDTERNVAEAIELYLESLAAHGEPIPEEGRCFQGRVRFRPNRWRSFRL
ncbi:MAG TPA: type II toxin-antitoxin system HicB family antitoxin [Bryobacteraceae bacterium]